jgi:hypothetical protein
VVIHQIDDLGSNLDTSVVNGNSKQKDSKEAAIRQLPVMGVAQMG